MIDVKQIAKRKNSGSGGSSASGSGFGPIGKIAEEAKHAARADKAAFAEQTDYANRAGYASRAAYADAVGDVGEGSPLYDHFLRKDKEDTAQKLIRFMEGLKLGDGEMGLDAKGGAVLSDVVVDRVHDAKSTPADRVMVGAQGFDLYMGADGKSHMYVDYLVARAKFFAASAEVRKVSYSGGTTIFSNAGSTIAKVTYVFDAAGKKVIAYKCYALADDGTTRTMNWWHVGMMALCQTFNVKAGETEGLQNRYYWRMVIGVGQETLEDSKLYDYVILSNVREFVGGEAMLPNRGVRVLADETGRVLRWGGVAVATVYDGELVSMAELFAKAEGRTTDDGGNVIAQRVFYGYEAVNGGEPDAPAEGDVIVQVGDQIRWMSYGNVIKLATSTEDNNTGNAPSITMYHGIGAPRKVGTAVTPYVWQEVTCILSPGKVRINADMFELFSGSTGNVIEPYVVSYELVPTSRTLVKHDDGTTTPNGFGVDVIKRVGSSKTVLKADEYTVKAEVTYEDGNTETLSLADLYESVLRNLTALKLVACSAKDATDVLAETDIAVLSDGKKGADGANGNDGANGTDGESAIEVTWNPNPIVLTTKRDSNGNVSVVLGSDRVSRVTFSRDGQDWGKNHIIDFSILEMNGCYAVVGSGDGFLIVIERVNQQSITTSDGKTITVPVTTSSVSVAAKYQAADGSYSYIYSTLTVNVDVSAVWGGLKMDMRGLTTQYNEISGKYNDLPLKTPGQLTEYTSTIKQTARDISLKVSETAFGRKNLLVDSAFEKRNVFVTDSYNSGIQVLDNVGGVNSYCLEAEKPGEYPWFSWCGDAGGNIKVEKGKTYTLSVWAKRDSSYAYCYCEFYLHSTKTTKHNDSNRVSLSAYGFSFRANKVWELKTYTFAIPENATMEYLEVMLILTPLTSKTSTDKIHCWYCQPMLIEGSEYSGWSMSKDDADYIGGNLLDNTDTLKTGGTLTVATENTGLHPNNDSADEIAKTYNGCATLNSDARYYSGNIDTVKWDLGDTGFVKQGQDYMFSFMAKGNKGGQFTAYFYKSDTTEEVFVEVLDRVNGSNQHTAANGNAQVEFDKNYEWKQYWVHWRVVGSNLPKYVLIRCNKGTDMYVSQPKLEYGATVTEYRATKTDYIEDKSVAGKLLDTGIDIEHKQITLTADKTLIRTNDGRQVALFGKDGLNASLVKAQRLETEGAEAAVKIENGMIAVLGRAGVPNIKFGVNSDGYAVMQYYDNAGNLLYDLGPAGLAKIQIQKASMTFTEWIDVRGTNLAAPYVKKKTYKSSKGTYSLDFDIAETEAGDRLLFGKYTQPGTLVSKNLGYSNLTHLYLYSAPRVDGAIVLDDDSRRGFGNNLDLTKAADGVYFTKEWPLAENGKLTNVATGPYIPADAKIKDNMQDSILLLKGTEMMTLPRCYFSGWMKQDKLTAYLKPVITRLEIFSWQEMQISANSGWTPPIQQ